MRMESHRPTRRRRNSWALAVIALLVIIILSILLWPDEEPKNQPARDDGEVKTAPINTNDSAGGETDRSAPTAGQGDTPQSDHPVYVPEHWPKDLAASVGPSPLTHAPISADRAQADYNAGLELYTRNQEILQAREKLNRAYISGHLSDAQAVMARKALEDLASRTVLAPNPYVNPDDPYMVAHTFDFGERLLSQRQDGVITKPGIIARLDLNVPARIIVLVNGLDSDTKFQAGRRYKMLRGPFHLVVYKKQFAADLYLQDLFIRRMPVAIGAAETPTPEGYFRVAYGGKTMHSTYYPPAETNLPNLAIRPGQPGYPLDPLGHNLKIEGIPQLGTTIPASASYAIHGTNEPQSIGSAASRGCIRFGQEDIQLIYASLMEYAPPENPRANWNRWSTVTIKP